MRFYNVLEKQERETCLQLMSSAFMDDDYSTRKVVCIMGGDGSLARTIQFLRTSSVVDQAMQKGKLSFCMLPFGTGNDGAQVFEWGASPENELWLQDLESLMRDIITSQTVHLSLWNAVVDGDVYNPDGEQVHNRFS